MNQRWHHVVLEEIRVGLRAVRVNALRSFLTTLWIVIGMAAVITMMVLGAGARRRVAVLGAAIQRQFGMSPAAMVGSWLRILCLVGGVTLGASARTRSPKTPGPVATTRSTAAGIDVILQLLRANQGIMLGAPAGAAESTSSLPYFQRFEASGAIANSVEQHGDGTVYASYTSPLAPEWYDVAHADDAPDTRDRLVRTGRRMRRFSEVQAADVDEAGWLPSERAFPLGRGPAPRWLAIRLPLIDPCTPDRARLARLEAEPPSPPGGLIARVVQWIRRREIGRLAHRLASPRCRAHRSPDWTAFFASAPPRRADALIRHATTPVPNSGAYCSRDVVSKLDPLLGIFDPNSGPPEWTTILARNVTVDRREENNGQRKYYPGLPLEWPGNHYVTWEELAGLAQSDTARLRTVLRWHGRPSHGDARDRPIPWISSAVAGVVTNSFLSGADYVGDHAEPPDGYWLGVTPPPAEPCGLFNAEHALCDDWIVFVRPDPEDRFLLVQDHEQEPGSDHGRGNFTTELAGSLETEIEQWLIPVGYRPEPGDRIAMTGRWVVDCGHDDWHAELHPIESYVAAHREGDVVVTSVVVTGDWPGDTLELDVWPPARSGAAAKLQWRRDRGGVAAGLTVGEQPAPADDPNHLHLTIVSSSPWQPLVTEDWNQVQPHATRRLAVKYRLWWSTR